MSKRQRNRIPVQVEEDLFQVRILEEWSLPEIDWELPEGLWDLPEVNWENPDWDPIPWEEM